jgi:hypothetical protein
MLMFKHEKRKPCPPSGKHRCQAYHMKFAYRRDQIVDVGLTQ